MCFYCDWGDSFQPEDEAASPNASARVFFAEPADEDRSETVSQDKAKPHLTGTDRSAKP
jgi:hypothetical protein